MPIPWSEIPTKKNSSRLDPSVIAHIRASLARQSQTPAAASESPPGPVIDLSKAKAEGSTGAPGPIIDSSISSDVLGYMRQHLGDMAGDTGRAFTKFADLLARPSEANLARHRESSGSADLAGQHRGFWRTLVHGESPGQYQSDTQLAYNQIAKLFGQDPSKEKSWQRDWVDPMLVQTLYDPTVVLGRAGAGERLFGTAERYGLPAVVKSSNKLARLAAGMASKVSPQLGQGVESGARIFGNLAAAPFEFFGVHGPTKLRLASRPGAQGWNWLEDYQHAALGAKSAANRGAQIANLMHRAYDDAVEGLSDRQYLTIVRAINGGKVNLLPRALRGRAQAIEQIFDTMPGVAGTRRSQAMLAQSGFVLPDWAEEFKPSRALGTRKETQFREAYHPVPHSEEAGLASPGKFRKRYQIQNPLTYRNPQLLRRSGQAQIVSHPDLYKEAAHKAIERFGREYGAAVGRRNLKTAFGARRWADIPAAIRGTTGSGEGGMFASKLALPADKPSRFADVAQSLSKYQDWYKAPWFYSEFPHQANISSLLASRDPKLVPAALKLYGRLLGMAPAQRERELADVLGAGATSLRSVERQTPEIEVAMRSGNKTARNVGKWYAGVSHRLWTFDDAAKALLYRKLIRQGMKPHEAAYEVNASLVDYSTLSPAAQTARSFLVPFASWQSKFRPALARNVLQHPESAAFLSRVSPALTGGEQSAAGKKYRSYGPLATLARELSLPGGGYSAARSAMGPLARTAASLTHLRPESYRGKNYFTYGQSPLLYGAENIPPGVGPALSLFGVGPFSKYNAKQSAGQWLKHLPADVLKNLLESWTRTYQVGN